MNDVLLSIIIALNIPVWYKGVWPKRMSVSLDERLHNFPGLPNFYDYASRLSPRERNPLKAGSSL